jgi:sulfur transfer complex TusBCD TusB component (DsrH family)
MRLRGLKGTDGIRKTKKIDYDGLIDLIVKNDKVTGMF